MVLSQIAGTGMIFELPRCHRDMLREFEDHSGEARPGDFIYDDENDHFIEAARVLVGRYLEIIKGNGSLALAAQDARKRLTLPVGAR